MKPIWSTIGLLIVLTLGTAGVTYHYLRGPQLATTSSEGDALSWLREAFVLNDAQLTQIETLHSAYHTVCAAHCRAIMDQRAVVQQLEVQQAPAPAREAAALRLAELDAECRQSLEAHVRAVAKVMGPEQGHRYLSTVLPRLSHFNHAGPPDLELKPHAHHDGSEER